MKIFKTAAWTPMSVTTWACWVAMSVWDGVRGPSQRIYTYRPTSSRIPGTHKPRKWAVTHTPPSYGGGVWGNVANATEHCGDL